MENSEINILVVDDGQDFSQLMAIWLRSKGYQTRTVPDGMSAIASIKEHRPDIVFMDLNMPGMDGIETIKRIRTFDKKLPIIIISAYLDKMKLGEVADCNVSGVFYKGEDFEKGLTLIESVLRTHKKLKG